MEDYKERRRSVIQRRENNHQSQHKRGPLGPPRTKDLPLSKVAPGLPSSPNNYNDNKSVVLVTSISAIVVITTILVGTALIIYNNRRKRKLSQSNAGINDNDSENGKLLKHHHLYIHQIQHQQRLTIERSSEPRRKSHEINFTIPHSSRQFSPLSQSRRVLSTPDLTQYDGGALDDSTSTYGGQYQMPTLAKQYSIDYSNSFVRCSLGALDPELYKAVDSDDDLDYPAGHLGRVWLTLEYQKELERLIVNIIKIRNLPSRIAGSVHGCDPIIKLCLLPDERRYLQSRQKRRTCNPRFDESFYFQVSGKSIDERILQITVFDVDSHKKFKVIGYVNYNLKDFDNTVEDKLFLTRDLSKTIMESPASGNGEILISLGYNDNIGRLNVTVFHAKGLPNVGDSYVKVSFLQHNKVLKSKKTSVIKSSSEPTFNELYTFKAQSLETASLVVQLMQVLPGHGKDALIGRVAFGSYMFAKGRALEHWNDMLSNCREQIRRWHYLQP